MENQTMVVNPQEFGLEVEKATKINESFLPKLVERDGLVKVYENILTKEISKDVCEEASTLRKKLVKVRTGIAEIHKVEKAFYLASGRYVDALKNKHTLPIEQMEEKLAEVEKYYENIEKERIAKLQKEREGMLLVYEVENVSALNLGVMSDDIWNGFLTGTKTNFEAKKEAERKAEADRIAQEKADAEERERVRIENEKLRKEADEREKAIQAERKANEEKFKAEQEKARKEREVLEAKQKAENDKAEAERKKLADELQAKNDAELKAENERKALEERQHKEAEKLAKAPIKKQLSVWVNSFEIPATIDNPTAKEITAKFEAFKTWALNQVESL